MEKQGVRQRILKQQSLYTLPPYLKRETDLQKIDLSVNKIASLPPEMKNFQNLEELILNTNKFTEFPVILTNCLKLHTLDLAGNEIKCLAPSIGKLKNLSKLWLGWNDFAEFPTQLCVPALQNLTELHISNNKISSLPSTISVFHELQVLDVSHNLLESLHDDICSLESLKTLRATNNKLVSLPPKLTLSLESLKVLDVVGNPLKEPPLEVCKQGVSEVRRYQRQRCPVEEDELADVTDANGNHIVSDEDSRVVEGQEESPTSSAADGGSPNGPLRRGECRGFTVKPNSKDVTIISLGSTMQLEIPPNALTKELYVTAKAVANPPNPITLSDHEVPMSDYIELGPSGYPLRKPMTVAFEVDEDVLADKTREVVVRAKEGDGEKDLKTWTEGTTARAEFDHFTANQVVNKPRQQIFTVTVSDIETLDISCINNDISVCSQATRCNNNGITFSMQLHNVGNDVLLRSCQDIDGRDGYFGMGTILDIKLSVELCNKVSFKLPLPEPNSDDSGMESGSSDGGSDPRAVVLRDHNDDKWEDITGDVTLKINEKSGWASFVEKKIPGLRCRYVVVVAERWLNVEEIANEASRLARKGLKLANFILLQDKKNPQCIYIDCVTKDKTMSTVENAKSEGYCSLIGRPVSRDVDLVEGQEVRIEIQDEGVSMIGADQLMFNSRIQSSEQVVVTIDESKDMRKDFTGMVDFWRDYRNKFTSLPFKIPKEPCSGLVEEDPEERPKVATPYSRSNDIDKAIDVLVNKLSPKRGWKPLARKLGLKDPSLEAIEHDNSDAREQIYQMFAEWKMKRGKKATVEVLVGALKNLEMNRLAEEIQQFMRPVSHTVPLVQRQNTFTKENRRPESKAQKKRPAPLPYQAAVYTKKQTEAKNKKPMPPKMVQVEPTFII